MPDSLNEQQEQRIYQALYAGNKIEAIKLHRQATAAGLKESKDFIEALERQLRTEVPERFSPKRSAGCAGVLALMAAGTIVMMLISQ